MTEKRWYVRYRSPTAFSGVTRAVLHSDATGAFPRQEGLLFKAEIPPKHWGKRVEEYAQFFDNPKPRRSIPHA